MKTKVLAYLTAFVFLVSCSDDEEFVSPKPRGYFRIDFPQKSYKAIEIACPYSFEIPVYSELKVNQQPNAEPCWQNLEFPRFKATVYLSYKEIHKDLAKYLDDAHEFANRHQIKASGLEQIAVMRDSAKVYGLLFDIEGNSASSVQFYLTDSTKHFLRGSLYFNCVPNSDSLKIVIDFLKKDIYHLINTTRWKS